MSEPFTITSGIDYMTVAFANRSFDLSLEEAWSCYYRLGELFYGVHEPCEDWEFPHVTISGSFINPTEFEELLWQFSQAIEDLEIHKEVLKEYLAYDWEGSGLLPSRLLGRHDWAEEGF